MQARFPLLLLVACLAAACDRRAAQPIEASDTTDTTIADAATTPAATATDPLPPPATSACAGLTGDALGNCRQRERAASTPPTDREAENIPNR